MAAARAFIPRGDVEITFRPDQSVFGNPLMGYAPEAGSASVSDDVQLLFMNLSWRDWEPAEGVYDIDGIREEFQLERWKQEGRHIVLRFYCDYPEDEPHLDIPDWLDRAIGHDGTDYDTSYGMGFSPNYENSVLIERHAQAVRALGEAFGGDGLIAFIELGSLGHWGEWHVKYADGISRLPGPEIREEYILPWLEAFPDALILMRRPFAAAAAHGFGVYNDMIGNEAETEDWLDWIRNGGNYSQTLDPADRLVPMPEFWKTAPAGGEFTSSTGMEDLLKENLSKTLELLDASHMTFIGPKIASARWPEGYDAVLMHIGYRLAVRSAILSGNTLTLTWENSGAAPFYMDWPVRVAVFDAENNIIEEKDPELFLPGLLPGEQKTVSVSLDSDLTAKGVSIGVGIIDPMTGKAVVRLAMECIIRNGFAVLYGNN